MPELPEVETSRRGIEPHLMGQRVSSVVIREARLRWPIPNNLPTLLKGRKVLGVDRRGKYLLIRFHPGTLLMHLGMSGSLRILDRESIAGKHDHFDLQLSNGKALRLRDPRRFGAVLWAGPSPEEHPLIASLGPEPLEASFNAAYLQAQGARRRVPIKNLIMDSKVLVGVGNIYASESLFRARIHPLRACNRISTHRYAGLVEAIREVLTEAITVGGTTLRDFQREDGSPGYFALALQVYGRGGEPCPACGGPIHSRTIGQRSSFFCTRCQH